MRLQLNRKVMALAILCQSALFTCSYATAGFAQSAPAGPVQQAEPGDEAEASLVQFALTQKQIEGLLAAEADIGAIVAGIPEDQADNLDAKTQAALEQVAKRYGFKDFDAYEDTADNVILILDGFDPDSRTYIGQETVLKTELATINADTTLRPAERKAALKQVRDLMKTIVPIKFPENIALVTKYYEKLSAAFGDNG